MKLVTLGTGSSGNCYILSNNSGSIILDCGLPFNEITCNEKFCGFANIDFVFTSHQHKDHSRALKDFKVSGVPILSYENIDLNSKPLRYGSWLVQPFPVFHNVENFGLLIKDLETNTIICYCTDFYSMPKIENVDYWIYEINYDNETLEKKALKEDSYAYTQVGFKNHNSLEQAIEYFNSLITKPKGIYVCHISLRHSNYKKIKRELKTICDNVEILQKGDCYDIGQI